MTRNFLSNLHVCSTYKNRQDFLDIQQEINAPGLILVLDSTQYNPTSMPPLPPTIYYSTPYTETGCLILTKYIWVPSAAFLVNEQCHMTKKTKRTKIYLLPKAHIHTVCPTDFLQLFTTKYESRLLGHTVQCLLLPALCKH